MKTKKIWVVVRKKGGGLAAESRCAFLWMPLYEISISELPQVPPVFLTKKAAEDWRIHWRNSDSFVTKAATISF